MSETTLSVGDAAPDFAALAVGGEYGAEGRQVRLADFVGRNVVLYFYPKDDTPGCTKQACGLRDVWGEFAGKAAVFGVSVDDAGSHQKFIDKFQLPFPLLSDTEQKIVQDYGVWVEKNMYGKKYMGTERSTFVIGGDGRLKAILRKVNPEQHAALVLAELG
ncbi:MAG: peroxiredoxin [Verrucomicrobia bacterium]|nr:peroxiredoxin [Verrucomicrobiota bacterium]